jgi:hypothetical protein
MVASKAEWLDKRRPELKKLFQHYMYGQLPPKPEKITTKLLHEDKSAFGGKATLKELAITVGIENAPPIYLMVVTPNQRKGPAPVFVGISFCGNYAMVDDPKIHIPTSWIYNGPGVKDNHATEAGRGKQANVWNLEQTIDRGYAVATFYNGDIDPDVKETRGGMRPFWKTEGKDDDTATIAAWSWGVHRAVDYVVTDKDLDAKRIVCVGHSRLGKTALLAAAFDDRIALAIPHQAGCGGTAPSRGQTGESVKRINEVFPHWFCGNFKKFSDNPSKLPFDQNCLVAICAPRPVLFTNAKEDTWANPDGQFEVLVTAAPVYRLLEAGGLDAKERPPIGKLVDSKLGYFIREGKHEMNKADWQVFLDYADKQLGKP